MSNESSKRKMRTRGHVIADLAVNYVERYILLAGFTMERTTRDYGLDTHMTTYSTTGEVENEAVWFQVKATDHIQTAADGATVNFRVETSDLRYWLFELMPVILIVYDAPTDRAFWLDVQRYATGANLDLDEVGDSVTLRIAVTATFDVVAVRAIRERKEEARAAARRPGA